MPHLVESREASACRHGFRHGNQALRIPSSMLTRKTVLRVSFVYTSGLLPTSNLKPPAKVASRMEGDTTSREPTPPDRKLGVEVTWIASNIAPENVLNAYT